MNSKVVSLFSNPRAAQQAKKLDPSRIQEARLAQALTQTDLARKVGVSRQAVSAYEQGSKSPEPDTLVRIASILQQPIAFFSVKDANSFGPLSARTYRAFGAATKKTKYAM